MSLLPARGNLDGSALNTTGGFQTAIGEQRDFLAELLGIGNANIQVSKAQAQAALGIAGMRNKIINGNFAINQRGVSGTVTLPAGAYGHDRWKAGSAGCTYSYSASGIDNVITISAGTLGQIMEAFAVEGGVYVISWEGTSQLQLGGSSVANSPFVTAAVPSGSTGFSIGFGPGTLSKVQIELATVPTPYERRPYPIELMLCQRYYCQGPTLVNAYVGIAQANSTSSAYIHLPFPVPMRAVPTYGQPATAARLGGEIVGVFVAVAITQSGILATFAPSGSFSNNAAVLLTKAVNDGLPVWTASAEL